MIEFEEDVRCMYEELHKFRASGETPLLERLQTR